MVSKETFRNNKMKKPQLPKSKYLSATLLFVITTLLINQQVGACFLPLFMPRPQQQGLGGAYPYNQGGTYPQQQGGLGNQFPQQQGGLGNQYPQQQGGLGGYGANGGYGMNGGGGGYGNPNGFAGWTDFKQTKSPNWMDWRFIFHFLSALFVRERTNWNLFCYL